MTAPASQRRRGPTRMTSPKSSGTSSSPKPWVCRRPGMEGRQANLLRQRPQACLRERSCVGCRRVTSVYVAARHSSRGEQRSQLAPRLMPWRNERPSPIHVYAGQSLVPPAGFEPATHGLGRASTARTTRSTCGFHVPEVRSGRVTRHEATLVRVTNRVTAHPDHWSALRPGWRNHPQHDLSQFVPLSRPHRRCRPLVRTIRLKGSSSAASRRGPTANGSPPCHTISTGGQSGSMPATTAAETAGVMSRLRCRCSHSLPPK